MSSHPSYLQAAYLPVHDPYSACLEHCMESSCPLAHAARRVACLIFAYVFLEKLRSMVHGTLRHSTDHMSVYRYHAPCLLHPAAVQSAQVLSTALQRLRSMVHEIVGRINGHYGTLTHVPIHHLDRQLNFHELCALYAITDVALVTSLRDGMNLVSYEYVACQSDNAGEADH